MAVALILDFPGGSMEDYRQVVERMDLDGRLPEGQIFHAAGVYDGGLRVIDTWANMAAFEAFRDAKILPYVKEVGLPMPEVQVLEVREEKPGSGRAPKLVQLVRVPGLDADSFAAMDAQILPDGRPPEQITFHVNGPIDGGWFVLDAWDSKADRDRFRDERIAPNAQKAPLTGEPQFEDLTVEATLGASAPAHA